MTQKRRYFHTLGLGLCVCVVGYFLYHTVQGERGVVSMLRLQHDVSVAKEILAKTQSENKALRHREELMRPRSLDPDLLDEEARKTLNYSKPNEVIILTPVQKTPESSGR